MPTTIQYLNEIVFPFFKKQRSDLGLPADANALLVWDVWYLILYCALIALFLILRTTHLDEDVRKLCLDNNVKMAIVTAGFTGHLSILDLVVNRQVKRNLADCFRQWV